MATWGHRGVHELVSDEAGRFRNRILAMTWPTPDEYTEFVRRKKAREPHEKIFGSAAMLRRFHSAMEARFPSEEGKGPLLQRSLFFCATLGPVPCD